MARETRFRAELPVWLILALSFIIGMLIIHFGLPYSLHPDESYIIKDPIKNLVNYSHFEFTSTMSLYSWLLIIWYGILFCLGWLLNQWNTVSEFSNNIILEDGKIFFYGRILSVILVMIAHYIIFRLIRKITDDRIILFSFLILFVFNPILLSSVYWIKFDAATYLASCIMLSMLYNYFILQKYGIRNQLYFFSFILLSIRIEIIGFIITFLVFDYIKAKKESKSFLNKSLSIAIIWGSIVFFLITFYPLVIFYKTFYQGLGEMPLASQKTFEKAIGTGIINEINSGKFFYALMENFIFYLKLGLFSLLPIILISIIIPFRYIFKKTANNFFKREIWLLSFYIMVFSVVLLLFPYHSTHYFVSISVTLLFLTYIFIIKLTSRILKYFLTLIICLYSITLSLEFLLTVSRQTDTRILGRDYIINNTKADDLLAIETISINGYNPLIAECPEVLKNKSIQVKNLKKGTGLYYDLKAQGDSGPCRIILDVFTENYLKNYEWINDYNIEMFRQRNPLYFITTYNIADKNYNPRIGEFYNYVLKNYSLIESFALNYFDPRLNFLLYSEPYFKNLYVYKRIN